MRARGQRPAAFKFAGARPAAVVRVAQVHRRQDSDDAGPRAWGPAAAAAVRRRRAARLGLAGGGSGPVRRVLFQL